MVELALCVVTLVVGRASSVGTKDTSSKSGQTENDLQSWSNSVDVKLLQLPQRLSEPRIVLDAWLQ